MKLEDITPGQLVITKDSMLLYMTYATDKVVPSLVISVSPDGVTILTGSQVEVRSPSALIPSSIDTLHESAD